MLIILPPLPPPPPTTQVSSDCILDRPRNRNRQDVKHSQQRLSSHKKVQNEKLKWPNGGGGQYPERIISHLSSRTEMHSAPLAPHSRLTRGSRGRVYHIESIIQVKALQARQNSRFITKILYLVTRWSITESSALGTSVWRMSKSNNW